VVPIGADANLPQPDTARPRNSAWSGANGRQSSCYATTAAVLAGPGFRVRLRLSEHSAQPKTANR
jgi:hypothetical protein